jgi:hypothetical protein
MKVTQRKGDVQRVELREGEGTSCPPELGVGMAWQICAILR